MHLLMSRAAHVFSVEDIIQSLWGGYGSSDQALLKNVVYRLRKKIEADQKRLKYRAKAFEYFIVIARSSVSRDERRRRSTCTAHFARNDGE